MHKNLSPTSLVVDPNASRFSFPFLPAPVQRKIVARWQEWVPWVRIHLLRSDYDAAGRSAEFDRLLRRHSEQLVRLMRAGIGMRLVRSHKLDDPRISDEVSTVLMRRALERKRKAWLARHRSMSAPHSTEIFELDNFA